MGGVPTWRNSGLSLSSSRLLSPASGSPPAALAPFLLIKRKRAPGSPGARILWCLASVLFTQPVVRIRTGLPV